MDNISLIVAFSGGLLSFLSPCVLPMVPVYLGSLHGPELFNNERARLPMFLHSLSFVTGFTIFFVALGTAAGFTGRAFIPDYYILGKVAGSLLVAFGLFIFAATLVPWLNYEKRLAVSTGKTTGYLRSCLIGAAFSLGWTACVGPVLAGILAIASIQATAWQGAYLLATYSLGLGLPFLAIGAAFDYVLPWLKKLNRYSNILHIASGALLVATGIFILSGNLKLISYFAG